MTSSAEPYSPQPLPSDGPRIRHPYLAHPLHGPLPAVLIALTVITGMVDALSILALGRVFVANMTGNVVFIAFAIGGAPGFSLWGSVLALAGFIVGAAVGGLAIGRIRGGRGVLLRHTLLTQFVLTSAAVAIALSRPATISPAAADVIVLLAALGLGLQNATVRQLAVPDMTTTVLTMAITGIGADLRARDGAALMRRTLSVLAMFIGALAGTLLVLRSGVSATLSVIAGLYLLAAVTVTVAGRGNAPWQHTRS